MMGSVKNITDLEIARGIFDYADSSITVSASYANDIQTALNLESNTFRIIPNMAGEQFCNVTPVTYKQGETFRFFTNSFLVPRKNIQLGMDALKILAGKNIPVHLIVGGDGPLLQTLMEYAKYLGLEEYISFKGQLSRQKVKQELDNCHSFLLTSHYESFGVSLLESITSGRPAVYTDSMGPQSFMKPEYGIMATAQTPEAVATAMLEMITTYEKYDQSLLASHCAEMYNPQKIANELLQCYQGVMSGRIAYNF
jgi:glycosyltransferase involved in cell wall biosynthesis